MCLLPQTAIASYIENAISSIDAHVMSSIGVKKTAIPEYISISVVLCMKTFDLNTFSRAPIPAMARAIMVGIMAPRAKLMARKLASKNQNFQRFVFSNLAIISISMVPMATPTKRYMKVPNPSNPGLGPRLVSE